MESKVGNWVKNTDIAFTLIGPKSGQWRKKLNTNSSSSTAASAAVTLLMLK